MLQFEYFVVQIHCVKEVEQRGLGEVGIYRIGGLVCCQLLIFIRFMCEFCTCGSTLTLWLVVTPLFMIAVFYLLNVMNYKISVITCVTETYLLLTFLWP